MKNKVTAVIASDGRVIHAEQQGVFRRSNKQNELVALLNFPSESVVKVNFIRSDGVKPNSQYMSYIGVQEYENVTYSAFSYMLTDYQLDSTGSLVVSLDISYGNATATSGDFTIDVEASEDGKDDVAPTDPNQYDEALKGLMLTDSRLIDRTENVPNLVKSIQLVEGSNNAITYTDNSDITSAPIVLGDPYAAPIPINAASTIEIPATAWQPTYAEDNTTVTGYTYALAAALHGEMRDGATARDLWVSFDEAVTGGFKGVTGDYTVNEAGDITITVNTPVAMTVRVWNGKGLVDNVARDDIAAETERAETAEQAIRADLTAQITAETQRAGTEEAHMQTQINELVNTGIDTVARAAVAAETERAEAAEEQLSENQQGLQNQISVNASDIQGLRDDITNESHFRGMYNNVADLEAAYPTATPNDYAWIAGGNVWTYTDGAWTDTDEPVPSTAVPKGTATPLMDGTASAGTSTAYASEDHRHPSDTTKANTSGTYPNLTVGAATKATNDGNGNTIASTYVKKKLVSTHNVKVPVGSTIITQKQTCETHIADSINLTILVSNTPNVYCFVACSGTVTIPSDMNAVPNIRITNSPYLTLSGKTASNWYQIFIDGEAIWQEDISTNISAGGTEMFYEGALSVGDIIQIWGTIDDHTFNISFRIPDNSNLAFCNVLNIDYAGILYRANIMQTFNTIGGMQTGQGSLTISNVKKINLTSSPANVTNVSCTIKTFIIRRHR